MILLNSSHDSWESEALFVKIAARILDLWFNMFSGPKWPKCSFWVLNPKVKKFFEISWFYWIHLIILEKMRSCLWKLQLGFWTYGLIHFLGPAKWPKCSFWVLNHRVNFFGRCYDFIGFISWFLRKWGPVCENCSLVSGHMAWQVLCQSSIWAQIVLN